MDEEERRRRLLEQAMGVGSDLKRHMDLLGLSGISEILRQAQGLSVASETVRHAQDLTGAYSAVTRGLLPHSTSAFDEARRAAEGIAGYDKDRALKDAYLSAASIETGHVLGSTYRSMLQATNAVLDPLTDLKKASLYNQELYEAFRARQQLINSYGVVQPNIGQLSEVAATVAGIIRPYGQSMDAVGGWKRDLVDRMGVIPSAWALASDLEFSGMAFGELTRLGAVIRYDGPFSEETDEYVIEELGQLVAVDADADEDAREGAYSVPRPAYGGVLSAAGFSYRVPAAPVPVAVANGDGSAEFDPEFYAALTHLEQHVRRFVQTELMKLEGTAWLRRRVPEKLRTAWKDRQEEDRAGGRPVYEPIHYANFMDLADIICQTNNWSQAFVMHFKNPEAVRVSLLRLFPMRNGTAHARPRTQTDMLYLAAEADRLLRAIGIIGPND
jgi:hypothetical protein